jgi:hypothetical protein
MTNSNNVDNIADLIGRQSGTASPAATLLTPDVRSGATFPFVASGLADNAIPPFVVIWAYTVLVSNRQAFVDAVLDFESDFNDPPTAVQGSLSYRGTYSISVSSLTPEFEYRTIWGLTSLSNLQALNDLIANTENRKLQTLLALVEKKPAMRAEIMGLTKFSKILVTPEP